MAWRMVVQPDGLYARFSEVVDNFTHADLSREEAFELCRDYGGRECAETKLKNADAAPERWQEAVNIIRRVHGEEKLAETLADFRNTPND